MRSVKTSLQTVTGSGLHNQPKTNPTETSYTKANSTKTKLNASLSIIITFVCYALVANIKKIKIMAPIFTTYK